MMWNGTQMWESGLGIGLVELGLLACFGGLLLLGIVLVVIWLARGRAHPGAGTMSEASGPHPAGDAAVRIARERLARGEITREEFDGIMQALGD